MDFQALYKSKLTTADEAVKLVKSGDWVDYTWCTNHPYVLDQALAKRQNELEDVKVRGGPVDAGDRQGRRRRGACRLAFLALLWHRP